MSFALEHYGDALRASVPLARLGTPADVAGACIFLASRAGAFLNGATIALDGGNMVSKAPSVRL